jgi:hypothetical protein
MRNTKKTEQEIWAFLPITHEQRLHCLAVLVKIEKGKPQIPAFSGDRLALF